MYTIMSLSKTELRVIMFVDVCNYTKMTEFLSYSDFNTFHNIFDTVVKDIVESYSGIIVNKIGDAFLCSFEDSFMGVSAGLAMQKEFSLRNELSDSGVKIQVRVSLNKGPVLLRNDDVLGTTVNIASRINSFGSPSNVLVSEKVHDDLDPDFFETKYFRKKFLKGISEAVKLYKVKNRYFEYDVGLFGGVSEQALLAVVLSIIFVITIFASFML